MTGWSGELYLSNSDGVMKLHGSAQSDGGGCDCCSRLKHQPAANIDAANRVAAPIEVDAALVEGAIEVSIMYEAEGRPRTSRVLLVQGILLQPLLRLQVVSA